MMRRVLLRMPEAMRCALLCMLEAVEDELYLLEVMEMMRRVLLCMLDAVEGGLYWLGCWRCCTCRS